MLATKKIPVGFFKRNTNPPHLAEAGVDKPPPQISVLGKDGSQICTWMNCKDYVNDTVWGHKTGNSGAVYGWKYDPKKDPKMTDSNLILAYRWPSKNKEMESVRDNVKRTVEVLERRIKMPKFRRSQFSTVFKDDGEGNSYFVIFASRDWMRTIPAVSFFTWLVRIAATNDKNLPFEEIKPFCQRDGYYFKSGKVFIDKLLKKGLGKMRGDWGRYKDIYSVHNNGFVTWSGKNGGKPVDENQEDWEL